MHIAFITFEYPPDIDQGGIATYTLQVATLLQQCGHDVEVFSGSYSRDETEIFKNVKTHRIKIKDVNDFRHRVVTKFTERHLEKSFDIIESPEINGNGLEIKKAFKNVPLTVKLHTASVFQVKILNTYLPLSKKLRFVLGAVKQGRIDLGYWSKKDKNQLNDVDYQITQLADSLSAPSHSMKKWAIDFWEIKPNKIDVIPYPYIPDKRLLQIPLETNSGIVTFHGKLNVHKGLVAMSEIIPNVLKKCDGIKFRLAGKNDNSHIPGVSMQEFLENKLKKYLNHIEFTGPLSLETIPEFLSSSDLCIFPSIWDNFPLVCLEAMSAGRAIIASNEGGMKDMLEPNGCGILLNPFDIKGFVNSTIFLLKNPLKRSELGNLARNKILNNFNAQISEKQIINFYNNTIQKSINNLS